jgi:hypothetical protein
MARNPRGSRDEFARRERNEAFVAMFLAFRDGKIVSQQDYDCYPPFGAEPGSAELNGRYSHLRIRLPAID